MHLKGLMHVSLLFLFAVPTVVDYSNIMSITSSETKTEERA
jgi:hypothetical protein